MKINIYQMRAEECSHSLLFRSIRLSRSKTEGLSRPRFMTSFIPAR
jgi:hypothetical protein